MRILENPHQGLRAVIKKDLTIWSHVNTIETRQGLLKDNRVDLTVKQLLPTTMMSRNEEDLGSHWLHFPVQGTARSAAVGAIAV